ncbi:MAG: OsmC family protein [Acidimicrobiales bacterium]|nr:OsmC family protein [Acidimicrobiales bacterium]
MADTDTRSLNGIDMERLGALFEQAHASEGPMTFELGTRHRWLGGQASEGYATSLDALGETIDRSHHTFHNDLPAVLAGDDAGPGPTELLLGAVGACVTTALVQQATAQGIRLDRLEIDTRATLDARGVFGVEGTAVGPQGITLRFSIDADAEPEQLEALANAAIASSPTAAAIAQRTPVRAEVRRS